MGTVLAFDFNRAFFDVAKVRDVALADVDPGLARAIEDRRALVGLPKCYPGMPEIEFGEGEVTADGADEFAKTVERCTVGDDAAEAAEAFREGFERVIPWDAMNVFSAVVMAELFRGSVRGFSREELRRNIEGGHGYSEDAPQIEMLVEVLAQFGESEREMFVRFVTGARALPIGGLAALAPKLTVAMRVSESGTAPDNTFPSVMTCANYLKLPQYSSAEVLAERLRYAITECQNAFGLT
jgi:E3 ubiquitin-protein ligase TRIP12